MPEVSNFYGVLVIDQLVKERKRQGVTQQQLSALTGINQTAISRIESKRISPTIQTVDILADALGCSLRLSKKDAK